MSPAEIAARIADARASGVAIPDFTGVTHDPYIVQDIATAARRIAGGVTIGRKIGLTSQAAQQMFGVHEPDSGWLWADCRFASGDTIATPLIAPRVEAEIALVLGRDVDDPAIAADCVDHALPAIEIVDSAIADWDVRLFDTVADNASGWGIVLGMTLARNGTIESRGIGAATLGGPLKALDWLAHHAAARGVPLRAGEIVMTGALGPVLPAVPGDQFTVLIDGFDSVTVTFA